MFGDFHLPLNASRGFVSISMWLHDSQQLLSRLDIADVSVLSSRIPVQETGRDLDVVIDSLD